MKPIIIDNFLDYNLLNDFLHDTNDDYMIDEINHNTGVHFIPCDKMILSYNKQSRTECLINHIINFIKLKGDDISRIVTHIDMNDIRCIEYWNKHLFKSDKYKEKNKLFFHFDSDEQNLVETNKSNLSIVYYFKKKYENGLLIINKQKNYCPDNQNILYKTQDEILNDITILDNYHIIEPLFNRLVIFNGGEYCHGITEIHSERDSLVMNLWINPPLKNIIKHKKNNIYVIDPALHQQNINELISFMNKYCENDNPINLSTYVKNNNDRDAKSMDNLLFSIIHNIVKYIWAELGKLNVTRDSGYTLKKVKDDIVSFHPCNKILYIEYALDDVEYEFKFFDNVKVSKHSFLIVPYCWIYDFKIINKNYIMRMTTDMS